MEKWLNRILVVLLFVAYSFLMMVIGFNVIEKEPDLEIKSGEDMPGEFYGTNVSGKECVVWEWEDEIALDCDFPETTTTKKE